jgi:multidrug resistance efflux pump
MMAQTPQEVLEAVRRLEADLARIRAGAHERERDLSDLRADIAADAARERQSLVEDMERLVDLIGVSWRATHDQIAALAGEVQDLRRFAEEAVGGFRDATMELHFGAGGGYERANGTS